MISAVTFDAGQTLIELDAAMLAARLGERGLIVDAAAIDGAAAAAWRAYDRAVAAGIAGHPWKLLMTELIGGALGGGDVDAAIVEWLWTEQPRANLWRRPVAGMIELVRDLVAAGVPVAVVSNSEGGLAALLAELGWAELFRCIADSGALGVEKPAPGIFRWTLERLGVAAEQVVHVGDSRAADVAGALAAGWRAIWFGPAVSSVDDPRVAACRDAASVRAALRGWGLAI